MARVATKLTPKRRGGWTARKRIPGDVQAEYARLYDGGATEARFSAAPDTPIALARALEREWRTEIETRIANIRAAKKGDAQSLSPKQARALAGEWYDWYLDRKREVPQSLAHWEYLRDEIHDQLIEAVNPWRDDRDPERQSLDDILKAEPDARVSVRPILADYGQTAQFLARRVLALDRPSMNLFLDALYSDLGHALQLLIRNAKGDYSPDVYRAQFPEFEKTVSEQLTATQLFNRPRSVDRWANLCSANGERHGERFEALSTF